MSTSEERKAPIRAAIGEWFEKGEKDLLGHLLWEMKIKIGPLRIDTILSGPILTDLCR